MYIQYVADILCFTVMHIHTQYNEYGNVNNRVPTHPWKSFKFKALKVLEKRTSAWKSLNFISQVFGSPWIHHKVKLRDHQIRQTAFV